MGALAVSSVEVARSTKSDLMFVSKQSEVAKSVEKLGLKEPIVPPMKIVVDTSKSVTEKNNVQE